MYDLDAMKRLDLPEYAQRYGFRETEKSTVHARHLRNAKDIIVCKPYENGTWSFWSPSGIRGDIINFVAWQENCKSYDAMVKIAKDMSMPKVEYAPAVAPCRPMEPKQEKPFSTKMTANWKVLRYSKYLRNRALPERILQHPRFLGSLACDPRCNVVFPHYLDGRLCGYTQKNRGVDGKTYTYFSKGGHKTIWVSRRFAADRRLVVGEAGIDMLSKAVYDQRTNYQTFFRTRYCSTDGGWSPDYTVPALKREISAMPQDAVVVAAFDNDPQGEIYTAQLAKICEELSRRMVVEVPQLKDWNEQLQHDYGTSATAPRTQMSAPAADFSTVMAL